MTAGASRAAPTIAPQPALAPSPQPRPAPTARALPPALVEQGGQNWTPIGGQICKPIDSLLTRDDACAISSSITFPTRIEKDPECYHGTNRYDAGDTYCHSIAHLVPVSLCVPIPLLFPHLALVWAKEERPAINSVASFAGARLSAVLRQPRCPCSGGFNRAGVHRE